MRHGCFSARRAYVRHGFFSARRAYVKIEKMLMFRKGKIKMLVHMRGAFEILVQEGRM